MLWAVERPARYRAEQTALGKLSAEVEWLKSLTWSINDALLQVNAELVLGPDLFPVELVYPALFPDTPAFIRPGNGVTERWSAHQYGAGGVLCLEWGPDNWHSDITGAELLRSAYKLLSSERPADGARAEVPSRHKLTAAQGARGITRRVLIEPAFSTFATNLTTGSCCRVVTCRIYHEKTTSFFIAEATSNAGEVYKTNQVPPELWESFRLFCWKEPGWLFKCASFPDGVKATCADLISALRAAGFTDFQPPKTEGKPTPDSLLFVFAPGRGFRCFAVPSSLDGPATECMVLDVALVDPHPRLPAFIDSLQNKRVGIVGLGSVGSKVAISLARSGIKRFLLVDDDLMLPGNLSRHQLDWSAVGAGKAEAVKEALSIIAPDLDIQYRTIRLAGQESAHSASTALAALAACDLIIDATASPAVFVLLAAVAKRQPVPMVWGELFAGAIGAFFARSRPGKDPDPLSMRAGLLAYLEQLPKAPFRDAQDYDVTVRREPLIAFDSEVAELAAVLARLAIDTLANPDRSVFPHSAYLQGFKQEWIFSGPFDTRPLDLGSLKPDAAAEPVEQAKVLAELIELAKPKDNAAPGTPR
jgi:hypothetical protein